MMIVEEKTESSFLDNLLAAIDDEDIKELNISKENPSPKIENRDQAEYYVRRYKELKAESDEIKTPADDAGVFLLPLFQITFFVCFNPRR